VKQLLEIDALYRDRSSHTSSSPRLQSSVCPSTAYSIRRDAWLHARRSSAAAVLQASARVLHAHACLHRKRAAELLQFAWRQHAVMMQARAAGGKAATSVLVSACSYDYAM